MMRSKLLSLVAVSLFTLSAASTFAEDLDLSEGTMSLDGKVAGHLNVKNFEGAAWGFGGELGLGYFVMDNLAVGFGLGASFKGGTKLGVGLGLAYFFDTGSSLYPYLGAGVSSKWGLGQAKSWNLGPEAGAGVLLGLNRNVALDLGVKASLMFDLNNKGNELNAGFGYLGVRSFF